MVCQGTKRFVQTELEKLGYKYKSVELGEIDLEEDLSQSEIERLDSSLHKYGLEIMFNRTRLVKSIRLAVLNLVKNDIELNTSFSYYISDRVGYNYTYLNQHFTRETGVPIDEYYIEARSEKSKINRSSGSKVLSQYER
jgi:hypothetical protein